jgi:mRNA-degrading endonuclease toxin of MazEF toxin-antitoxin module
MFSPGEIYMADVPRGQKHPVVVLSREELNKGLQVITALITSVSFDVRSRLANCVPIRAGKFGITKDCVIQCENVVALSTSRIEPAPVGKLDAITMRDVVKALGYVFDADCEPT